MRETVSRGGSRQVPTFDPEMGAGCRRSFQLWLIRTLTCFANAQMDDPLRLVVVGTGSYRCRTDTRDGSFAGATY